MGLNVSCVEHKCVKQTAWGPVEKSLNQHLVYLEHPETNQNVQCGIAGVSAFMPLAGFPQELVDGVAAECSKILGKPLAAGVAPPSIDQIAQMIDAVAKENEDEDAAE